MDRGMLNRATSSDDSPTPGYMYGEIAKMTFSSVDVNRQILEFLVKRLSSKNAHVKRKSLVLIKHLARTGRPEFRRDMCRNLQPIKECLQFTGPPDPLRGDEAYQKVREAAKEAMDAVTSSEQHMMSGVNNSFASNDFQSSDASTYQQNVNGVSSFSSTGTARSGYEGFGSAPLPKAETYTDKAFGLVSAVKEKAANAIAGAVAGTSAAGYVGGNDDSTVAGALPGTQMPGYGSQSNISTQAEDTSTWSDRANQAARRAGVAVRNFGFRSDVKEDFSIGFASNRGSNPYNGGDTGSYNVPSQLREYEQYTSSNDIYPTESSTAATIQQQEPPSYPTVQQRARGAPGGSWGQSSSSFGGSTTTMSNSYSSGFQSQQQDYQGSTHATGGGSSGGGAKTDGEYERTLVNDLCSAGGTRSTPPPEKLATFLNAAKTLEAEVVGPNVLDLLDDEKPWQVKCKALSLIEALATAEGCVHHKEYFADVAQDLAYLAAKPPVAVQRNARKMLSALGISADTPSTNKATRHSPPAKVQEADFNDVLGISPTNSPKESTVPTNDSAPDLLGDYVEDSTPPTQPPQAPDLGMSTTTTNSLFEDLSLSEATPEAAPAPQAPSPPTPQPDLFGDVDLAQQQQQQLAAAPQPTVIDDPFAPVTMPLDETTQKESMLAPPTNGSHSSIMPPTAPKSADPFSELTAALGTPAPAPMPTATGPAFVPSVQHHPNAYQQQQMHMYMQQQQQQQRQAFYPNMNPHQPVMVHHSPNMPPPIQQSSTSGFDFMATDNKAKQADSFAFVNDLMN